MEIKHLKEFLVLAAELNYSNAAELLFISQPVLTKHIQALEAELGLPLFIRSARKVTLTEFGAKYCECAEHIVREYERGEEIRRKHLDAANTTIELGAILNFQDFGLDRHMIEFNRRYPEFRFEMVEASDRELLALFNEGRLNMFTAGILDGAEPGFDFVRVGTGSMYVYINERDPLASMERLRLGDLSERQIFLPYRGTELLAWIEKAAREEDVVLDSKYYGSQEAAKAFVRANMGIAIIHVEGDNFRPEAGIRTIRLDPSIDYSIGLGYRRKSLRKAELIFLRYAFELMERDVPSARADH